MKHLSLCRWIRIFGATAVPAVIAFVSPAFAHDAKFHKGPMIEGKLISVTGDKAEVETKDGKTAVALSAGTKYESGKEGSPATKSDLKPGCAVMIHGHKLPGGTFGAMDVMIQPASGDQHAAGAGNGAH